MLQNFIADFSEPSIALHRPTATSSPFWNIFWIPINWKQVKSFRILFASSHFSSSSHPSFFFPVSLSLSSNITSLILCPALSNSTRSKQSAMLPCHLHFLLPGSCCNSKLSQNWIMLVLKSIVLWTDSSSKTELARRNFDWVSRLFYALSRWVLFLKRARTREWIKAHKSIPDPPWRSAAHL